MKIGAQHKCAVFVTLLLLQLGVPLHAVTSSTINIVGVVQVSASCEINNNQPIDVNFGDDLLTTKVDGENYKKPVPLVIVCKNTPVGAPLKIQLQGVGANFNSTLLKTNNGNLGIALINSSGNYWGLNTWLNFTYGNTPSLLAVPLKNTSASLTAGAFSGAGTMVVDFQ